MAASSSSIPPSAPAVPAGVPAHQDELPTEGASDEEAAPDETEGGASGKVKKKKKKKKKSAKKAGAVLVQTEEEREEALVLAAEAQAILERKAAKKPPPRPKPSSVLCISRNKHWRHISAYHGPWLQLPVELLESLLSLNLDPVSLSSVASPRPLSSLTSKLLLGGTGKEREKGPTPPPIDPGVFRSVINIRRLVDEASDLAIRASSGLSAFSLANLNLQGAQLEPPPSKNGRPPSMSAIRTHKLRALACQRLAEAYKWDEIAASVMVMQGASALDDLAEKVLKIDPENPDALYVHFFHEKIPSRMVAENTTTDVLDALIAAHPSRLEFYRTRGVVKIFLDQFVAGARDFTHALVEARAARKDRVAHSREEARANSRKAKGKGKGPDDGDDRSSYPLVDKTRQHASIGPGAPLPMEPQCLFLRGSSYLMHAVWLIESSALRLEEVDRSPPGDGMELRLCNLSHGKYGAIEIGNPDGPLGSKYGKKLNAYRDVFGTDKWKTEIHALARKSIRDHERFLAHFDQMESVAIQFDPLSLEDGRGGPPTIKTEGPDGKPASQTFTTYHPLLVESHYSILLNYLLLGDFPAVLDAYLRVSHLVDGLEGYPVFLPARSMAQAEFIEVFERLLTGWQFGATPDANASGTKLITSAPSASSSSSSWPAESSSSSPLPSPFPSDENGARSSSPSINGRTSSPSSGRNTPSTSHAGRSSDATPAPGVIDRVKSLDAVRTLIAKSAIKVKERNQRQAEKVAEAKRLGKPASFGSLQIPLSGPRVEVILVWIASVVLPELEEI